VRSNVGTSPFSGFAGGIHDDGTLTLDRCKLTGNVAERVREGAFRELPRLVPTIVHENERGGTALFYRSGSSRRNRGPAH
jgi:hypothetical protein